MNRTEHLLTCLAEECLEVAQRATKALRFSLAEVQPGQPLNNARRIASEAIDLFAILEMLEEETGYDFHPNPIADRQAILRKRKKVEEFMRLSSSLGTLNAP